jgi:hypothetical protein
MTPDPRWLEILKASGWQTAAVAAACGLFLIARAFRRSALRLPGFRPWRLLILNAECSVRCRAIYPSIGGMRLLASRCEHGRPVGRPSRCRKSAAYVVSPIRKLARLLIELHQPLVAVAAKRGARRGHGRRACGPSERRDGNQRDQRESSDKLLHDTSPCYGLQSQTVS